MIQQICVLLMIFGLVACSSAQLQKAKTIVMKIEAGAKTAVVTGCKDLPAVEVDIALVEKFVPPGSTTTAVEIAIASGETTANVICARVAEIQAANAKAKVQ